MRSGADEYRDINRREGLFASPRPTRDRHVIEVTGAGDTYLRGTEQQPGIRFTTYFLEEPSLTFGGNLVGGPGVPFVIGSVLHYYINDNGMYYGCDLQVRVEAYDRRTVSRVYLTFEGTAMKVVPKAYQGELP